MWREPVQDAWIDYNGHLSEAYYVLVLGHATDGVLAAVGLGPAHRAAHPTRSGSLYTVEAHLRYLAEVPAGVELEVRSSVIGASSKLLWIWHELWSEDRLRATEEVLGVHVVHGVTGPLPPEVAASVAAARVDPPAGAGAAIRLRG